MNKRIVSLLVAVVMVCSMLATAVLAFAAPADSGMSASVTEAYAGQTFTVTLKVPGFDKQISDLSLKVLFNNTAFEVTEFTAPAVSGMTIDSSTVAGANEKGLFSASYNSISAEADVTFSGMELTATVKVKEGAALGDYAFEADSGVNVGSLTDGLPDILLGYNDLDVKSVTVSVVAAPVPATGVSLNKTAASIKINGEETLVATVSPADSDDTVAWTSSDDKVATVDAAGKVTAVGVGTATITAKAGSVSASCKVTVTCDHTGGTATCVKKAVCTVCGNEYGDFGAHDYTAETQEAAALKTAGTCCAEAVYYYSCAVCGEVEKNDEHTFQGAKDPDNHVGDTTLGSDDTNHWHICSGCNEKLDTAAHEFEWVIDKEATETEKGTKHEKCKVCGFEKEPVEYEYVPPVTPATGDNSMLVLWVVMLLVSGLGVAAAMLYSRKRRA